MKTRNILNIAYESFKCFTSDFLQIPNKQLVAVHDQIHQLRIANCSRDNLPVQVALGRVPYSFSTSHRVIGHHSSGLIGQPWG